MHGIRKALEFLVAADSPHDGVLGKVIDWAEREYASAPTAPDGQVRGLEHCLHDAENARKILDATPPVPGLTPEEKLILAAALVTHDVGRKDGSDGHGVVSGQCFMAAEDELGLDRTTTAHAAEVVSMHDLAGDKLRDAANLRPGWNAVERKPRDLLLALMLKLADLMDTTPLRLAPAPDPGAVVKRKDRVIRLARKATPESAVDPTRREVVVSAVPRSSEELAALRDYLRKLREDEFAPLEPRLCIGRPDSASARLGGPDREPIRPQRRWWRPP